MPPRTDPFAFLPDDSVAADEVRAFDWNSVPLGPPDGWPPALRAMLSTVFHTPRPMFVAAGTGRTLLFNDSFRPMLGPAWAMRRARPSPTSG